MDQLIGYGLAAAAFAGMVGVLYVVISRVTRMAFGPRRRLEEEVGLAVLRGRLARAEITQREFDAASHALTSQDPR